MSKDATSRDKSRDKTDSIEPRIRRAVCEKMSVLPTDEEDVYEVIGQNGGDTYRVDARTGECSCPDAEYNLPAHKRCKHGRRLEITLGERPMPPVDPNDVDPHLGEHVDVERDDAPPTPDATPRRAVADGGEIIEAGDDAEILGDADDAPAYTYHREPARVGGATYVRCGECGAECVPANPDRLLHYPHCEEGDDGCEEPTRSEPADFGGGESTGVQHL